MLSKQLQEAVEAGDTDIKPVVDKFMAAHKSAVKKMAANFKRILGWPVDASGGGWQSTVSIQTPVKRSGGGANWSLYLSLGAQANYARKEIELVVVAESPSSRMDPEIKDLWERFGATIYGLGNTLQTRYGLRPDPWHNPVKYGLMLSFPLSQAERVLEDIDRIAGDISGEMGRALKKAADAANIG